MADNDSGRDTAPVEHGSPSALDRFFEITQRGSSVRQEIRGGIVAFVAMAYIVVLNPLILGGSADVTGGTLDFARSRPSPASSRVSSRSSSASSPGSRSRSPPAWG